MMWPVAEWEITRKVRMNQACVSCAQKHVASCWLPVPLNNWSRYGVYRYVSEIRVHYFCSAAEAKDKRPG